MKKLAATVLAALFSASAFAATAYMDAVSRQVSWTRPDRAVNPVTKQDFKNPSDGTLAACGIVQVEYEDCDFKYRLWGWEPSPWCRAMDAAERAAIDAAEESARTNAEYLATLPVPMPTGVEVPWVVFLDATNRQKGIAMELTTNNVPIYYEFHASPVDWKKVDANRAAAMSAAAAKEKDSADAIAYAKDKDAKDKAAKAAALAATAGGKEPTDKEKTALMWKHYLAVVGAEK